MKKTKKRKKFVTLASRQLDKAKNRISELNRLVDDKQALIDEKQELLTKAWEKLGRIEADSQRCELIAVFTEDNRMRSIKRLCAGATFDLAVKAFLDAKGMWKQEEPDTEEED